MDDDEYEIALADAEVDCEACPLRLRREGLTPEDHTAMVAWEMLSRGVTVDLSLAPLVFDVLDLSLTAEGARDFFQRLDAIHSVAKELAEERRERGESGDGSRG